LTDLHAYDVVLGKLVARSLTSIYGLFGVLPLLAISMLMGGVTAAEFWRIALVLGSFLILSLCLGLAVSAFHRDDQRAMLVTLGALLALTGGIPLVDSWFRKIGWGGGIPVALSPALTCLAAFDTGYRGAAWAYWHGVAAMQGMILVSLVSACLVLPRVWHEKDDSPTTWFPLTWFRPGNGGCREPPIFGNPVTWITLRTALMAPAALWGLLLGLLAILLLSGMGTGAWTRSGPWRWGQEVFGLGLRVLIIFQAGRLIIDGRRSGNLGLLLATPLTQHELLGGQVEALRRRFLWPTILGIALHLLVAVLRLITEIRFRGETVGMVIEYVLDMGFGVYGAVVLVADLAAGAWLSMMLALTLRQAERAPFWALVLCVLLPYLLFCVPRILVDLPIIMAAQDRLRRNLRALARNPSEGIPHRSSSYPPRPQWSRWTAADLGR